MYQFKQLLSY